MNLGFVEIVAHFIDQAGEIETRADAADRARQNVVEHQRRNGKLGQSAPHGLMHHAVDAAAHEHAAALDVNRADRVREQHDAQNEPGRRFADRSLRDPARIVRR